MPYDDITEQLLKDLADAKTWPERFKEKLDKGTEISKEISKEISDAEKRIEILEKQARQRMKKFGCTSPATRSISLGIADMLINWYSFKDAMAS